MFYVENNDYAFLINANYLINSDMFLVLLCIGGERS